MSVLNLQVLINFRYFIINSTKRYKTTIKGIKKGIKVFIKDEMALPLIKMYFSKSIRPIPLLAVS